MGYLGLEPRTYRLKAEYSTIELATLVAIILAIYDALFFSKKKEHLRLFTKQRGKKVKKSIIKQ